MGPKTLILSQRPGQDVDRSAPEDLGLIHDVRRAREGAEEAGTDQRSGDRASGRIARVRALLSGRHAHSVVVAIAIVLSLPTLWQTLDSDDYLQIESIRPAEGLSGLERAPWDLYAYAKDPASNIALREEGVWPWWTDVDVVMSFFRPLASLTRWVDQTLWPGHVWLMQLHSLLWFVAVLAAVSALYRRLHPVPWIGTLAMMLFAFDETRAATIAWLCNRNALVALCFSFGALLAHHRYRREGRHLFAWLGPVSFALGLLGGEGALQVCGYLFAYALFLDRGPRLARFASLLPYALVVICWGALYKALGYGAVHSGFYIDPLREPLTYLAVLPERLIIYGQALFTGVSADWFNLLPLFGIAPRPYLLPLAVALAVLITVAIAPLFRRDPLVRFWVVGALLAALPTCGASPSDRLIGGMALGGMGVLASLLGALCERTYPNPRGWLTGYAWVLVAINLVIAPLLFPRFTAMVDDFDHVLGRSSETIPSTPDVEDETVVLLNPPFDTFGLFLPPYRAHHGIRRPKHFRWLATGVYDLRVERVDAHTLKIAPKPGFLANSSQLMLRSLRRPMPVGERVRLEGVTFEVASLTADRRPAEVLVRFDQPLDAKSLRFLRWDRHGYVPFELPAVGANVVLPAVDMTAALTGPT